MTLFAGFGITDKPLDNDAFFKAGSEQLKVSTNSKSNLSAAQSIGNDAKHAQNAVFDGNDPKLSVSAARPLGTGAAPTQNANFVDDDPHRNGVFYAEAPTVTEYEAAAAAAEAAVADIVIHESTIIHHSTEPAEEIIFHQSTAAAEEDDIFALVDNSVASDDAMRVDHAYRSNNDTPRYYKRMLLCIRHPDDYINAIQSYLHAEE